MSDTEGTTKRILSPSAATVAVLAVLLYLVVTVVLFFAARHAEDPPWSRYVYLYSGLEGLVFAAAGALFGAKVQRSQADAEKARADRAETESARAQSAEREQALVAQAAYALRDAIEAERQVSAAERAAPPTGRRTRSAERIGTSAVAPLGTTDDPALDRLSVLAARLLVPSGQDGH
jgi:hypothetical protein